MRRRAVVVVVAVVAAAAAGLWAGLGPGLHDPEPGEPGPRASSPSPTEGDSSDGIDIRKIRLSSRSQLVEEVAELGFDEVMVLSIGRPVHLQHYTTHHLRVVTTYATSTGEVRLLQSDDQGITAGPAVFIRGIEGVHNGEGASWVERDYLFDLNPLKRRYVRALRWAAPPETS